jgi:hypothetical protein
MTDYLQLAEDLYDALKRVRCFSISDSEMDNVITRYEQETTRGTGRTTALYMKAIAEALENPGKTVDFIDHYPHTQQNAKDHTINLRNIIEKLGYTIDVNLIGTEVVLYNRFKK